MVYQYYRFGHHAKWEPEGICSSVYSTSVLGTNDLSDLIDKCSWFLPWKVKDEGQFVRDSHPSLKFLTFQLSNVRELETIKYAYNIGVNKFWKSSQYEIDGVTSCLLWRRHLSLFWLYLKVMSSLNNDRLQTKVIFIWLKLRLSCNYLTRWSLSITLSAVNFTQDMRTSMLWSHHHHYLYTSHPTSQLC